jgi:hypothetical protein
MMFIHYYDRKTGKDSRIYEQEYSYACTFYIPYDPKFTEMKTWVSNNYKPCDYRGSVEWGELFFAKQEHAAWFLLKWS